MSKPIEWIKLALENWKVIAPILILVAGGTGYSLYDKPEKPVVDAPRNHQDRSIQIMKDHLEEHN